MLIPTLAVALLLSLAFAALAYRSQRAALREAAEWRAKAEALGARLEASERAASESAAQAEAANQVLLAQGIEEDEAFTAARELAEESAEELDALPGPRGRTIH